MITEADTVQGKLQVSVGSSLLFLALQRKRDDLATSKIPPRLPRLKNSLPQLIPMLCNALFLSDGTGQIIKNGAT